MNEINGKSKVFGYGSAMHYQLDFYENKYNTFDVFLSSENAGISNRFLRSISERDELLPYSEGFSYGYEHPDVRYVEKEGKRYHKVVTPMGQVLMRVDTLGKMRFFAFGLDDGIEHGIKYNPYFKKQSIKKSIKVDKSKKIRSKKGKTFTRKKHSRKKPRGKR